MIRSAMRDQNAIPEIQYLKILQSRIALLPSAGVEVALQTCKLRINIADLRERGNTLSNHRIQVKSFVRNTTLNFATREHSAKPFA